MQVDISPLSIPAKHIYADSQAQRFHLRSACLAKQARKRAGVSAGVGLGAKVDSKVGSKYGAARQEGAGERQNCGDWTSKLASHVLPTSPANKLASSKMIMKPAYRGFENSIHHAEPLVRKRLVFSSRSALIDRHAQQFGLISRWSHLKAPTSPASFLLFASIAWRRNNYPLTRRRHALGKHS
jgi:hypothetical protein